MMGQRNITPLQMLKHKEEQARHLCISDCLAVHSTSFFSVIQLLYILYSLLRGVHHIADFHTVEWTRSDGPDFSNYWPNALTEP